MEPIPETLQAFERARRPSWTRALLDQLRTTTDRARAVAPGLVGVSVASREEGITFTLVATAEEIAVLDAVQYVASGPCVDAMDLGHGIATSPDGLLERGRGGRTSPGPAPRPAIHSTLTLPVVRRRRSVATVNLYGHAEDTFVDHHEALADIFGAWAPGAVANADLSFTTQVRGGAGAGAAQAGRAGGRRDRHPRRASGASPSPRRATRLEDAGRRAGIPAGDARS